MRYKVVLPHLRALTGEMAASVSLAIATALQRVGVSRNRAQHYSERDELAVVVV